MNEKGLEAISKLTTGALGVIGMIVTVWLVVTTIAPIAQQIADALDRQADALEIITRTYIGE